MIKKFLSCCFSKTPKTYPNTLSEYETLCLLIEKVNECVEQVNVLTEIITNFSYEIADGSITTTKIADLAITGAKIADGSITTQKIVDSAVTGAKIAGGAITTPKIVDSAVTGDKIADGAITYNKIGIEEVDALRIAKEAVTNSKIAPEAVTTSKIDNGAVNNQKIAPDAVSTSKIKNEAVTGEKVANGAITPLKLSPEVRALYDSLYVEQSSARGVYARDFMEGAETTTDTKIPFTYTDGTPDSIVQRDGNGRVRVSEPVDDYNPVPFRYLNELSEQLNGRISQLSGDLDNLANRVSALEQA